MVDIHHRNFAQQPLDAFAQTRGVAAVQRDDQPRLAGQGRDVPQHGAGKTQPAQIVWKAGFVVQQHLLAQRAERPAQRRAGAGGIAVGVGVGRDQNAVVALQRRKQSFRHSDG